MGTLIDAIRDGAWVSERRVRLWAWAFLIGFALAGVWLLATAQGLNDFAGRPLGTDFSDVYAAGRLALAGQPEAAYDVVRHHDAERALFGAATPFYGWHYPPFFLTAAEALARLPYPAALLVWLGATFALYLLAMRLVWQIWPSPAPRTAWLAAIAFPAVFVNAIHGQNGFLTAALFAGGLGLLVRRPFAAGLVLGLMVYKPQFAVLIPLALLFGRRWKALAGMAVGALGLGLAATAAFGPAIWSAFAASTRLSREIVLEQGAAGFEKIQSLFAAVRHLGGSVPLAYAAQGALALAVTVGLVRLWRGPAALPVKGAGLILACLLATPYGLDYDLVVLAPALALWTAAGTREGFGPYEKTLLAGLWVMPVATRLVAGATCFPLGVVLLGAGFASIASRAPRH